MFSRKRPRGASAAPKRRDCVAAGSRKFSARLRSSASNFSYSRTP